MLKHMCVHVQHVSTTDVQYYLALKIAGQEDLVVAYKSLLPRLAIIRPVYQQLLQHVVLQQACTDCSAPDASGQRT